MTVFRTQWLETVFVGSFKTYILQKFSDALSNDSEQSINKHMVKFKSKSGMKQCIKSKPIKCSFKFWFCCPSESDYLYQMDIYLEFNLGLGKEVVLQLTKELERSFYTVYFNSFFDSPKLIENYSKKAFMVLEQFEPTESKCRKWSTISRWKGKIASSFFQVTQWLANGWIIGQCCFYHLPFKEWMTYYQFRGEKKVQRPSLGFSVLWLSGFTKVVSVELILWTRVLADMVWIERHLLAFTDAFSLNWWILHLWKLPHL